jgi:hypothetical protein
MHTDTATAAPAAFVVVHPKGDSSRIMLAGSYASAEDAYARANRIRRGTSADMVVAPVTPAYVAARTVVAAF